MNKAVKIAQDEGCNPDELGMITRWGMVQSRQNISAGGVFFRAGAVGIKASLDVFGGVCSLAHYKWM